MNQIRTAYTEDRRNRRQLSNRFLRHSLRCSLERSFTVNVLGCALMIISALVAGEAGAQTDSASLPSPPAAPLNVKAVDTPNDKGGAATITWDVSTDEENGIVDGYVILRAESPSGPFVDTVGKATSGATTATDNNATDGVEYYYRVDAYRIVDNADGSAVWLSSPSVAWGGIKTSPQWFNKHRGITLFLFLIIAFSILQFINQAKRGKSYLWLANSVFIVLLGVLYSWVLAIIAALAMAMFIKDIFSGSEIFLRKIAGIDAVEEAIGRATEMGKKIFFIPGIQDMNDVQTIAGMAILGRVGAVAAEYETWLEVPVSKSMVMVTARETMKEAYSRVGRPDLYQEAQVHFVTEDQFGYAAALDGMFVREKPATIFYMGAFFAESLILAETGNEVGAIQIAGTAMPAQLPFFVAACDYTLIGEELFAASAYLSREPRQLGSLKGQDVGKALFLAALVIGLVAVLISHWYEMPDWLRLQQLFNV